MQRDYNLRNRHVSLPQMHSQPILDLTDPTGLVQSPVNGLFTPSVSGSGSINMGPVKLYHVHSDRVAGAAAPLAVQRPKGPGPIFEQQC